MAGEPKSTTSDVDNIPKPVKSSELDQNGNSDAKLNGESAAKEPVPNGKMVND